MTEQNHGDSETESGTKHENKPTKDQVWRGGRSKRMDIFAFAIGGLAALMLTAFGVLYSHHNKKLAILLFGFSFLFFDIAVCFIWFNRVASDDSQPAEAAKPTDLSALWPSSFPTPSPKHTGPALSEP